MMMILWWWFNHDKLFKIPRDSFKFISNDCFGLENQAHPHSFVCLLWNTKCCNLQYWWTAKLLLCTKARCTFDTDTGYSSILNQLQNLNCIIPQFCLRRRILLSCAIAPFWTRCKIEIASFHTFVSDTGYCWAVQLLFFDFESVAKLKLHNFTGQTSFVA